MMQDGITARMAAVMLRQLGAVSVMIRPSYVSIAEFDVAGTYTITYMYEIRENKGIYLQRINPYPIQIGKAENEDDLVKKIADDFNKFKMAYNSRNFPKFITLVSRMTKLNQAMENLFMAHNVPSEYLKKIGGGLEKVYDLIELAEDHSTLL